KITLTDSNGGTDSQNIMLTVAPSNDAPVIRGVIPNFNKDEDASNWEIDLAPYKFDVDNHTSELTWYITGWDSTLFNSVNLAGEILSFDLAPDAYGSDEITLTLSDGLLDDTQNIWINVAPVNDVPVILGNIPNFKESEDSQSWIMDLTTYESDVEDNAPSPYLTWSVLNVNTSLITVSISDNNLTFTPVPDAFGNVNLIIRLTDSNGAFVSQGIWIEITPINDAPTIDSSFPNIVLYEDTPKTISLLGYGIDIEDSPGQLRWVIEGANSSLYSWEMDPATNMLTIDPQLNAHGLDDVTITLIDGGWATDSKSIQILVIPINDPPYIHPKIPDSLFRTIEDEPISVVLTGFENDIEDSNALLSWEVDGVEGSIIKASLISESDELVIVPMVVFSPDNSESVETEITLILYDSQGLGVQQKVTVTIIPVNNAPVIEELPDLKIKYDDPFVFDLSPYIFDEDTQQDQLIVNTSEPSQDTGNGYIEVHGLNLTLLYPESKLWDNFTVLITVSDGQLSSYSIMQISVSNHKPPELLNPLPDVQFDEDLNISGAFDLDDYFIAYEDDTLNYSYYLNYIHHGDEYVFVSIKQDNTVDFFAALNWFGEEQITFRAEDNYGSIIETTIFVTVNPVNDAPIILDLPDQECKVNVSKVFDLEPYLRDVDSPSEDLMIGTDSIYITTQGHNLIFYYDDVTMETVNIIVSDGQLQDSVTIEVKASPNIKPSIFPIPNLLVKGGEVHLFSLLPYVSDIDNETEDLQIWTDSSYIEVSPYDNMLLQIDFPSDMVGDDVLVTVFISDGLETNSTEMLVHITNELIPRLVNNLPNLFFGEDTIFSDALNLNDYFQNAGSYLFFGNENVNITIDNGWVTLSASANWSGSEMITFRAMLGSAFAEDTIDVVVKPINDPPTIYPLPSYEKKVNEIWVMNLNDYIYDVDTPITDLSISIDSSHVILYAMNIYFQYQFPIKDRITLTVSDGENVVFDVINVNVTGENNPPTYVGLLSTSHLRPGETWSIDLDDYFYDIDGDILTFSCNKNEVVINPVTHVASWTPSWDDNTLEGTIFYANDGSVTIESSAIDLVVNKKKTTTPFWEQFWWLLLLIALLISILIAFIMLKRSQREEEIEYAIETDKAVEFLKTEGRGGNYLIKSETSEGAYNLFSGLLQSDYEGLCITTKQPEDLTDRYNLGKAWIIKLALRGQKSTDGEGGETKMMGLLALGDEEREDDKYIFSSNFKHIVETIEDFITGGDHKVVLLDGLEYILGGEELIMYIGFIASLRERLKDRNSCLLIPIDPKTLSDKELGLLERETVNLGKALHQLESTKEKYDLLGILPAKETEEVPATSENEEEVAATSENEEEPPPPPGWTEY
ncbi:MAG: tandem-95 repeat protein, partial [Thermoplasmata archaeon]